MSRPSISNSFRALCGALAIVFASSTFPPCAQAAEGLDQQGNPDLKSAGPLAFGPDGVLFVGDPQGAAIFAIDTAEDPAESARAPITVEKLDRQVAELLGTTADNILINDLAVNPKTGIPYLSVSRGKGPDATPAIVRILAANTVSDFSLEEVRYAKASLPNAPDESAKDRRGNSQRQESITDLAYQGGRVLVAGLSNEEFASKLRSIPFPFGDTDEGTSIEIYHGAHGKFETQSPVRTFAPYDIGGQEYLLAAYTCTPLVRIPVSDLNPGQKVKGTTIAELGNRNRPLDMVIYQKDGRDWVLMANSARGVMKIPTEGFDKAEAITSPIADKAGVSYETVADLEGVLQLDKYDDTQALLLVRTEAGQLNLKSIELP